jgi:hypothetical protein
MAATRTSVFISYAWSPANRAWVERLAVALDRQPDIHVVADFLELFGGADLNHFMDKGLSSDRVVVVITDAYVEKAALRRSGVGYESSVISSQLLKDPSQDRFIPVLREGNECPIFVRSKLYIDFRDEDSFERAFNDLLAAIRRLPPVPRPQKLGSDAIVRNTGDSTEQLPLTRVRTHGATFFAAGARYLFGSTEGCADESWFEFGTTPEMRMRVAAYDGRALVADLDPDLKHYYRYAARQGQLVLRGEMAWFVTEDDPIVDDEKL